jgi:SAM-dependent methyltransferase/uncharacterized protein YbaR (Trm112 family)
MHLINVEHIVCPRSHKSLSFEGTNLELNIEDGVLLVEDETTAYRVELGIPLLFEGERPECPNGATATVKAMLHKPLTRIGLPLLQGGGSMSEVRREAVERLGLMKLVPTGDGSPVRVLEVGFASGANLPVLQSRSPEALNVEHWGVDTNHERLKKVREDFYHPQFKEPVTLVGAHPTRLPFRDNFFDRVIHVGGLARYGDAGAVIGEIIRVCRPGGRVVVVTKTLAEGTSGVFGVTFKLFGGPSDPSQLNLPETVTDLHSEQLTRFFRCTEFLVGA